MNVSLNTRAPRQRLEDLIRRYWFALFVALYGVYVALPFLAPLLMSIGWEAPGRVIYFVYSFLCHQLPERSYFLFGPKISYSLAEIQASGQTVANVFQLRQFVGNPQMGWKMAWSDRMVSLYTSIWVFGLLWGISSPKLKRKKLSWLGLALFLLPMAADGGTHLISDLAGIGQGFRDSNLWLVSLTQRALPAWFYGGDAWGSFNALARAVTGTLAGMGVVGFLFPLIEETLNPERF